MVDQNKHQDTNTKASVGSEPGARKLTLSCSRCRASKLKCDRQEPCLECVKRNVGHLCVKDECQPRSKRPKTSSKISCVTNTLSPALQSQETEAAEAAQILEHFVHPTSRSNACLSADFGAALSSVAPDYPNGYWTTTNSSRRERDRLELIREIVDAIPEPDVINILYEVFVTRCQGPLGNVVHTPTFMEQAGKFISCLCHVSPEARVVALSSTIPMDTLACQLLALVLSLAFHPTPSLLCWSPTPLTLSVEELRATDAHSRTWRSLALRCIQGAASLFGGSIASLQAAIMLLLDGQEGPLALDAILVTAISGAQKLGLHRLGDSHINVFVTPLSSSEDGASTSTMPAYIRTEVGVRIWWALVMRDWSRGQALGYYTIHPSQFNTRRPLHINDHDLCPTTLQANFQGYITERPRSEFTFLSYTAHALEIAIFARESVDLRGSLVQTQRPEGQIEGSKMRNYLIKKYENFVAGLPSHFRLGSNTGLNATGIEAAIPVHRWMLHQQLWSLFLRLHRVSLSSGNGRSSCQLLAQNIISTQAQIQARCPVCGTLSTSDCQLFNAAAVLLIDLLFSFNHKDLDISSAQLSRLMTRDKIREALELLRTQNVAGHSLSPEDTQSEQPRAFAYRSVIALEALMKLEEEISDSHEAVCGASLTGNSPGDSTTKSSIGIENSLKAKVVAILEALKANYRGAAATPEQANLNSSLTLDLSMPLPNATNGFHDIDVLPVLSNDPNANLWQFIDFDSQSLINNGSFEATADWPNLLGAMSFEPHPLETHPSI